MGAYALGFHGIPRLTVDIDVFTESKPPNARRVAAALRRFGFNIDGIQQEDFMAPGAVMQLGNQPVRIDILTSISGVIFSRAWKRRVGAKYGNVDVWYLSKEDLILNKRASGRMQDEVDLDILLSGKKKTSPKRSPR